MPSRAHNLHVFVLLLSSKAFLYLTHRICSCVLLLRNQAQACTESVCEVKSTQASVNKQNNEKDVEAKNGCVHEGKGS